jgi:hypothetical protein
LSGTAADPADYTITASPITINAGSTTADITITVVDDALDEVDETVIVTMGTPTNAIKGATDVHTATIQDNDATPGVEFSAATQSNDESVTSVTVTAQLSAASGQTVSVPYSVTGTAADPADYSITSSPITITAGSTTADITITVVDDALDEVDETVIVTMGTPTNATKGATDVHTATITDNDLPFQTSFVNFPLGDIDQDGDVDGADAQAILDFASGASTPASSYQAYHADMNGSGGINTTDALIALSKANNASQPAKLHVVPLQLNLSGGPGIILLGNSGSLALPAVNVTSSSGSIVVTNLGGTVGTAYQVTASVNGTITFNAGAAGIIVVMITGF